MSTVEATYRNAWSLEWDFRMSARARNVWKLDAEKVIEGIKNQPLRKLFRTHDKALWIKLYLNSPDPVEKIADEVLAIEERRDIRRLARTFDPNQPRDENGKWTGGGGASAANAQRKHRLRNAERHVRNDRRSEGRSRQNGSDDWAFGGERVGHRSERRVHRIRE